jgi:hypothetical protein
MSITTYQILITQRIIKEKIYKITTVSKSFTTIYTFLHHIPNIMDIQSPSTGLTPINDTKPAKIPRPLNSFMIFRLEKQHEIVDQCPGANHRDISKIISKWWKEISAEEKQKYINEADKLKMKHRLL